jgi:hypothetical protein
MFFYKLLVVFTIVTAGLSISITESLSAEPERCCLPKQFSARISVSDGVGDGAASYVIFLIDILR